MEGLRRGKRGGILEAICRLRERLELCVFAYIPAHRGNSCSAYADAVAKAYLEEEVGEAAAREMRSALIRERRGREFGYEATGEGEVWAPWHDDIFSMTRDGVGAWVRARESGRVRRGGAPAGTVLIDEGRLGVADVEGNGAWWEKVLVGSAKPEAVERALMRSTAVAVEEATEVTGANEKQGLVWSMRNGGEVRQAEHGRAWKEGKVAEEKRGGAQGH